MISSAHMLPFWSKRIPVKLWLVGAKSGARAIELDPGLFWVKGIWLKELEQWV